MTESPHCYPEAAAPKTYEEQYRQKHHALVELYKLCRTLGNFKNGVEHNGIDEGEVYASGIFDRVEAALRQPYWAYYRLDEERFECRTTRVAPAQCKDGAQ